jgi:hypothetical protein
MVEMASLVVSKGVHGISTLHIFKNSADHLVIFFKGDPIAEGAASHEIAHLQDPVNICSILHRKYEENSQKSTIVVISPTTATTGTGTAAVYDTFFPKLTSTGEPLGYNGHSFKASEQLTSLLQQHQLFEVPKTVAELATATEAATTWTASALPTVDVIGFSKGGVVVNQVRYPSMCVCIRNI